MLVLPTNTGKETYKRLVCLYVPGGQLRGRGGRAGSILEGPSPGDSPKELAQAGGIRHLRMCRHPQERTRPQFRYSEGTRDMGENNGTKFWFE